MKLTIDIGNTKAKIALFEGKKILFNECVKCLDLKTVQKFVGNKQVAATIISSVKQPDASVIKISRYYNATFLNEHTNIPLSLNYKNPSLLGNDRLAAAVGAYFLFKEKDVIIIDSGTCLTIDLLAKNGKFIGGRISPGIDMRYNSMYNFTEKLPLVTKNKIVPKIGNDTNTSILSGVQKGILAEIESAVLAYRDIKPSAIILLTGGDYLYFEKELKSSIFVNPNLVLIGLNEILDFNE